jgi:hypothetical protein
MLFERAQEIQPSAATLVAMGMLYSKLENYKQAVWHFLEYVWHVREWGKEGEEGRGGGRGGGSRNSALGL